ncbi:MAG TPA: DinB family protein [Gemmatimonadaceae bacterium]|jgi:uncharacterized damage-inducible protein DinB|nr:DinB family protein [Gemmatimonadaceae bacterium]
MPTSIDLRSSIVDAWRTNCRVTAVFVGELPAPIWSLAIPASPRRTVRMLLGHLHNARSRWLRTLGKPHGIAVPPLVDLRRVGRRDLLAALARSDKAMESLLVLGLDSGNQVPPTPAYTWRNLPLDVGHVLTYFIAHEAHHRGQIVMIARELGHRLPPSVTNGLWQWTQRKKEAGRTSSI